MRLCIMAIKKSIVILGFAALGIGAGLFYEYHKQTVTIQEIAHDVHTIQENIRDLPDTITQNLNNESKALTIHTDEKAHKKNFHYQAPPCIQKDPLKWDWAQINIHNLYFPPNFLWGVATAAHQVEGNCSNNEWSIWEKDESIIPAGNACDHWNRYKEDIQRIKNLGVTAYRFSIEWSKIEPQKGSFNEAALTHYENVCKELVQQGIKPVITLHHYTNPLWFYYLGAFEKAENISYFVIYCKKVFERLHPYVSLWLTFNSPTSYAARAYYAQLAPPCIKDMQRMEEVVKNILEAHVQTYDALKHMPGGSTAQIGICHNIYQVEPKNFWDKISCNTAYTLFNESIYQFFKTGNFKVSIPFKANVHHYNAHAPQSLDFIGLNYYSHGLISGFDIQPYPGEPATQNKIYTIYPEGLYRALHELNKELAQPLDIPIYITENGIATNNEHQRQLFFERYLYALSCAVANGIPVKGYIVWALMDNYEWGAYDTNYGIYAVDFETQERSKNPRKGAEHFIKVVKQFSSNNTPQQEPKLTNNTRASLPTKHIGRTKRTINRRAR